MNDKMTIIFFSGTMDKAIAMLTLATTAASMGMEVTVFFTFWGLSFVKKKRSYKKKNLIQKMMEIMMPSGKNSLPLSRMNMLGAGPVMMKKLMKKTKSPGIEELFEMAKQLKVKLLACSTSCSVMGIDKDNLIDEVEEIVGAATYMGHARNAKVNLFI